MDIESLPLVLLDGMDYDERMAFMMADDSRAGRSGAHRICRRVMEMCQKGSF